MSGRGAAARRVAAWLRPVAARLIVVLAVGAVQGLIPGAVALLVQRVLDGLMRGESAGALPALVVGTYALNGALGFARGMGARAVAWRVVTDVRQAVFAAMLAQEPAWHGERPTGARVARLTADVDALHMGVLGLVTAVQKPVSLVALVGVAAAMAPRLAVWAFVALPLVALPLVVFGRRLRAASKAALDSMGALGATAAESLQGVRVVQALGAEAARGAVFAAENERQRRLQLRAFAARLLPSPLIELVAATGVGLVLWAGAAEVQAGTLAPGALMAFLVALGLTHEPLKGLAEVQALWVRCLSAADTLGAILDRAPRVADTGRATLPEGALSLEFDGVQFDYGRGPVLDGLSLRVPAGATVGLAGASGAGKSTLVALALRFADPSRGAVRLGGVDLRDLPLRTARRAVAWVGQDAFLFDGSVRDNLRLAAPDARDAALWAALEDAQAADFVRARPGGLDAPVGPGGSALSGGQRQRICVARALLQDARVLVLDEATSALDPESEGAVQAALARLMAGRTVLVIAHRVATLAGADALAVLEGGRIAEAGPPAALAAAGGAFARVLAAEAAREAPVRGAAG